MTDRSWRLAILVITGIALGLGLGLSTLAQGRLAFACALLLTLLAAGVFIRVLGARTGLVSVLIVTCFIDRFTYRMGSFDIRSEQIAALVGLAAVGYWLIVHRNWKILRPNLSEALLGVWLAIGLVSSLTAAPDPSRSLKGVALLAISSLGLLLPRRQLDLIVDTKHLDEVVEVFLIAFAAEATYGIGAFLAHVFGSDVSLSTNVASEHMNAFGTLWEPNVFGAFCAAGAVAWAWLGPRYFRFTWLGIALCLGGMIVSFTRAAWVAAFVVLVLGALVGPLRRRASLRQLGLGVAGTALIVLVVAGAEHSANYYVAGSGTAGTATTPASRGLLALLENSVDVIGRLDQVKIVWPDFTAHPVLGGGIASYGERHPIAGQPEQHIANLELALLNDTGTLGVLVFVAFALVIGYRAWRNRGDPIVAGLGVTALVIAITNTATETTELMITWVTLGLLVVAVESAHVTSQPSRPEPAEVET